MRAVPRRVFKRQDVWRLPSARQWMALTVALGAVLLLGNLLSLWVITRSRQQVAATLWELAAKPMTEHRGIVLPLFDGIALLGVSLIMELRAMQIDLPIEVPHCGDLSDKFIDKLEQDDKLNVRVYDVCVEAAQAVEVGPFGYGVPLFCDDVDVCRKRFRSFDIKVIALVFSRFQELMMMDADTLFLQNPMSLWELDKFVATGTLFFPDRIAFGDDFLSERLHNQPSRSRLHEFVEKFNRSPFQRLPHVSRATDDSKMALKHGQHRPTTGAEERSFRRTGEPSEYLKSTAAWRLQSGYHADSSLLLWSKVKQQRATAILASFVTRSHAYRPPSYGDKELYFLACEVADSDYSFSDFSVGSIGVDWRAKEKALCGDTLHFYPVVNPSVKSEDDIPALYINSDHIAVWSPDKEVLYRSDAKVADHFAGSYEKSLAQECLTDVSRVRLTERELDSFRRRQKFYKIVERWQHKSEDTL